MKTPAQLVTAEELFQMPDGGCRCELVAGKLKKTPFADAQRGTIAVRIACLLADHSEQEQLGLVFAAGTGFILSRDPDTVRASDIAFVRRGRLPAAGIPKGFWPGAPDLAVDVVSPDDTVEEVDEKVAQWLNAGTAAVWVVSPRWHSVTVYRSQTGIETLTEEDEIDGGKLLPGFRCRVGDFFVTSPPATEAT